jgi:Ca2+:H+ antiporter
MGKPILTSIADRIRSGTRAQAAGRDPDKSRPVLPTAEPPRRPTHFLDVSRSNKNAVPNSDNSDRTDEAAGNRQPPILEKSGTVDSSSSPDTQAPSLEPPALDDSVPPDKPSFPQRIQNRLARFGSHTKNAVLHSYVNILLVFVPIGIAANFAHLNPALIFAMNAIAIIPLAGLLTHATESVAVRLGDTLGALLNVSFGNAVELIIL